MRVGLDVSLLPAERAGGGRYVAELARALARAAPEDRFVLYPVFYHIFHPRYRQARFPRAPNLEVAFRRWPPALLYWLWKASGTWIDRERLLGQVDVVHSTTYCAPRLRDRRKRLVVTIYDVSFLTHPECHLPANVEHCLAGTRAAIERADALIAISESTRRDLIERMDAPADRIVVTPLAAGPEFRPVTDARRLRAVRARYRLPERFLLFVGAREPRKNLGRLLTAYAALPPTARAGAPLVLAGSRGWLSEDLGKRAERLGIAGDVHFPGYVAPGDLPAFYSLATVFAYPSLYEGFGLPVLEALACGTPVLTADTAALPEVAGDAALLVDPLDVDAMAAALLRLLEDEALRDELARRGPIRASGFSWERTARQTLAVYRAVTASGAGRRKGRARASASAARAGRGKSTAEPLGCFHGSAGELAEPRWLR